MKGWKWLIVLILTIALGGLVFISFKDGRLSGNNISLTEDNSSLLSKMDKESRQKITLPVPNTSGELSVEEAIVGRRSRREFASRPLDWEQVSQILWAAQGITDEDKGFRAAPSAGALYPLELYIVVGENGVADLSTGVYHYSSADQAIDKILEKDVTDDLMRAALNQSFIAEAPVSLVITAEYSRVTGKYGERGRRYVHMEAGHAAQNVYLQVESLGLGTVTVGAFDNDEVVKILQIPAKYEPLYVMPLGYPR